MESLQSIIQPVILAGGSGTRLWPASRRTFPKPLLALTGPHSLLQDTVLRLKSLTGTLPAAAPILVTGEDYRFAVTDQLGQVGVTNARIVLEPRGRNTAPALTVAALLTGEGSETILLVMPSDHLIRDLPAFHEAVAEGVGHAAAGAIVAFGVTPSRPETGYGYIHVGDTVPGAKTARILAGFIEKPDGETARRYLSEGGCLWNSGIFMVKSSAWLAAIERSRPDIAAACRAAVAEASIGPEAADGAMTGVATPASLGTGPHFVRLGRAAFLSCPTESIDHAVMEELGRPSAVIEGVVVPLEAGWSDLGTWEAVWVASPKDADGNTVRGQAVLLDSRKTLVRAESRLVAVLGGEDLVIVETADAVLVAKREKIRDLGPLVQGLRERDERLAAEPLEIIEVQLGDHLGENDIVRFEDNYGTVDE